MSFIGTNHLRIARPIRDLVVAERFWTRGLDLEVLHRGQADAPGEQDLLMVGHPEASWHLELVHDPTGALEPKPTEEDLLVLYLDGPVPDELVTRLQAHGGTRVSSANPYWNTWGVTVEDPDGYRLVLCTRSWSNKD